MIKNNTGANYDQDEINYQQNLKKIFYNTISALEEKLSKLKDKKRFKDKNRLNKAYQYYFADLQDSLKKHPDLKKYYRKIISQHPKVNAMLTACEENLGADKNQQNAVNQMNFFQHSSDCKIGNMLVFKAKNWKITYENQIFKLFLATGL